MHQHGGQKQRYVDEAGKASPERARRNLQRSFDEYQICYHADPKANTWHGINIVALLARAEKDKIALKGATDCRDLARTILAALDQKEEESIEGPYAWDLATRMESSSKADLSARNHYRCLAASYLSSDALQVLIVKNDRIRPFRIEVTEEVLGDLRQRLKNTRFSCHAEGENWALGTDIDYLRELRSLLA